MYNKRISWIDYTKAFACFLVALGHLLMSLRSLNNGFTVEFIIFCIYLFHMPLFICISGILYFKKSKEFNWKTYKNFEIKKIANLIIPYITFYVIFMTLNTIFASSVNTAQGIEGWIGILNDPVAPYWFLYALTSIFIFVPLLDAVFENKYIFSFILLLILKVLSFYITTKIYFIDSIMKWGVYFYLGRYISLDSKKGKNRILCSILSVIAYIISAYVLYVNMKNLNEMIYNIINMIFAILGIIICITIFKRIEKSNLNLLDTYKNYTLQIFLTHTIFAAAMRILLFKIGVQSYFLHFTIGMITSIYAPVIMGKISEKLVYTEFFFYPTKTIKKIKEKI